MRELLEQILLEYDPKKETLSATGVAKITNQGNASTRAYNKEWDRQERASKKYTPKKKLGKVSNRALARGGASDRSSAGTQGRKLSGPKGKLAK